jgi:hypothetical protein
VNVKNNITAQFVLIEIMECTSKTYEKESENSNQLL